LAGINISLGIIENKYTSRVYSLLEMLGDVGGLFDAIRILSGILLSILLPSLFNVAVVKSLFKFRIKKNQEKST